MLLLYHTVVCFVSSLEGVGSQEGGVGEGVVVSVCDPSMMCGMMRVIPSSLPAPPLRAWLSGHVNENNETHEVESMVRGRRAMALTSTWSL